MKQRQQEFTENKNMALDKDKLNSSFLQIIRDAFNVTSIPAGPERDSAEKTYESLAEGLSTAVHDYVIAADVTVISDLPVTMADASKVPVQSTGNLK